MCTAKTALLVGEVVPHFLRRQPKIVTHGKRLSHTGPLR